MALRGRRRNMVLAAVPDDAAVVARAGAGPIARLLALGIMLASPVLHADAGSDPRLETADREVVGIASVGGAVLRTRVLRPQGQGPFPVAIISHGSPADPAQRPVDAFVGAGGQAEYVGLPAFGSDGHRLLGAPEGGPLWQPPVEKFLAGFKSPL
jgi:hypothetical protein